MPRPSKKAERTEQILQAFERCVARYGLDGSSLERIAEEAGLQRPLVRHFVGNRDALVQQLADRVIDRSDAQWQGFLAMLPAQQAIEPLLDGLFSDQSSDADFVLVIESLIFAAGRDAVLRDKMQGWLKRFVDSFAELLQREYPAASATDINAVAFGLLSIYFNLDSLAPLQMNSLYREDALSAARRLLASLPTA